MIAETLGAEKLVFLTDVEGIRASSADPTTLIHRLDADELDALVASGAVGEGMVPKATACAHAVSARRGCRARARRTGHPCPPARAAHERRRRDDGDDRDGRPEPSVADA